MTAAEQISTFCSALLGGPDGTGDDRLAGLQCYAWTLDTSTPQPRKRTRWGRADDPAAIASALTDYAQRQPSQIAHVYFGTGLVEDAFVDALVAVGKAPYQRAKNTDVAGIVGLTLDIDIAGVGHADLPYPADETAARSVYQAVDLDPSLIIHSGHGLHVWWLFAEPWCVRDAADPDAERAAMAELSEAWSQTMRYHARRLGDWRIDSTFDLARVMRVPGTWNCKPGAEPVPARILEYHPARRYEIADFETRLVDPAERATRLGITTNGAVGALPGVDLMAAWRRATSLETRAENYTPEWLAMLLEAMPGSPLEAVWLGDKTLQGDASPSGVDASLTRLLINTRRVNDEQIAEALMCRRLRTGDKPEKVDPTRRTDYLITTISRIRASAATLTPTQAAQQQHWERGAAGRVVTMEPPPGYDAPRHDVAPDEFTDYVLGELDSPANGAEAASNGAAAETVAPVAPTTPAAEAPSTSPSETPRQSAAATPLTLAPPPLPELEQLLWPTRTADAAECFRILGELLLPDPYRAVGIEIWAMEYRDQGEQQKGRMILRIPAGYEWPASNRPRTFRADEPFRCAWYGRDKFDVPRGYRMSLSRDALLPALPVGNNREAWATLIDMLVPYWQPDSSRSDLITQVHEWLLDFLIGHAATLDEATAVDHHRARLLDHAQWGTKGKPLLYLSATPFLDFVARQPGGLSGRNAKVVLDYLDLTPRRPRWVGSDGRSHRANWYEVGATQFTPEEWHEVLTAARDAHEAGEARRLRVVRGGSA